jgi:hypothetical protein
MIIDRYPKLSAALMVVLSVTLAVSITQLLGLLGLDARAPAYAPIAHPVTARVTTYSDATVVDTVLGPLDGGFRTGDLATLARGSTGLSASTVFATGAMTAGDGAGGTFIWAPSAPTADDGCTVIVPIDSSGHPSPGAWVRQWSGPIDVRWCGASSFGSAAANTVAINNAYKLAVARQSAYLGQSAVLLSGSFRISGTILVGAPGGGYTSVSTIGEGNFASGLQWDPSDEALDAGVGDAGTDAGVDGLPVAQNIAVLYWNNIGATMRNVTIQYVGATPATNSVGLALSGPTASMDSNQDTFDTVTVYGFATDVAVGGVNTAVAGQDCAAQIAFNDTYLEGATYAGIQGGGDGNSLEISFKNGGLAGNYIGAALGTAGGWSFEGGGSSGNTFATFVFLSEWQGPFSLRDWRFEMAAGEIAMSGATQATVDGCTFQMTAAPTGYNVPISLSGYTAAKITIRNCAFANNFGSDYPEIAAPSNTTGSVSAIEFVNNRLDNPASVPFFLYPGGASNGMRYSMWGNYLDGGNQGLHIGTIVDGGMVDSVSSP